MKARSGANTEAKGLSSNRQQIKPVVSIPWAGLLLTFRPRHPGEDIKNHTQAKGDALLKAAKDQKTEWMVEEWLKQRKESDTAHYERHQHPDLGLVSPLVRLIYYFSLIVQPFLTHSAIFTPYETFYSNPIFPCFLNLNLAVFVPT